MPSRRDFLSLLAASSVVPLIGVDSVRRAPKTRAAARSLRIRTITAGVGLETPTDLKRVEAAFAMLDRAKHVFEGKDYEVQTLRVATPPRSWRKPTPEPGKTLCLSCKRWMSSP